MKHLRQLLRGITARNADPCRSPRIRTTGTDLDKDERTSTSVTNAKN